MPLEHKVIAMSFLSSCCGRGRIRLEDEEALIPKYEDDTALQRRLHQKMHSYQMLRALSQGFMPSTEQLTINLRTLLASDVLNPENPELSDSGRRLLQLSKQWLHEFIELLQTKNNKDQIQDFMWFLTKARISLDTEDVAYRAKKSKVKADTLAAYESLRTVGTLLFTNSDFRTFVGDLGVIGRQVFADTAFSLSNVAEDVGKKVEPSTSENMMLTGPGKDQGPAPDAKELAAEGGDVATAVANGLAKTGSDAIESAKEHISGDAKDTLLNRLKQAILKLRKRPDYNESVSTIGLLIQRYAKLYSRAVDDTIGAAQVDVKTNDEVDRAVKNFWSLLRSFGEPKEWDRLQKNVEQVMGHGNRDPEFEGMMADVGTAVEKMLSDPAFFDHADEKVEELKEKSKQVGGSQGSTLRADVDNLILQAQRTFRSVVKDQNINKLIALTTRIYANLSPAGATTNKDLIDDSLHVFVPLLIKAIQYIPIPRLEVATPDVDLLLENLILEPGRTVNQSSFLPYRLRIETQNNVEVRKARFRTHSSLTSLATIKVDGLTLRADELGYWMRAHSGLARLTDEGIADFHLDERGLDIHVDIEIGRERLEHVLTLRDVRVKIHHLSYNLRKSKFSWLAWLLKPLLRPILRKVMEKQLSNAIGDFLHAANRELLFARERLRATRISDPQDLKTFIRAIITRLTPEEDPDLYTAVGVKPSGNKIFQNRYAPGSVVKLWNEQAKHAEERIEDFEVEGWRNEIFDTHTRNLA